MIIIGIVLSVFGLGFFCWLLFTLAVYALPFLAGLTAGHAAFHSGAGVIGALGRTEELDVSFDGPVARALRLAAEEISQRLGRSGVVEPENQAS